MLVYLIFAIAISIALFLVYLALKEGNRSFIKNCFGLIRSLRSKKEYKRFKKILNSIYPNHTKERWDTKQAFIVSQEMRRKRLSESSKEEKELVLAYNKSKKTSYVPTAIREKELGEKIPPLRIYMSNIFTQIYEFNGGLDGAITASSESILKMFQEVCITQKLGVEYVRENLEVLVVREYLDIQKGIGVTRFHVLFAKPKVKVKRKKKLVVS